MGPLGQSNPAPYSLPRCRELVAGRLWPAQRIFHVKEKKSSFSNSVYRLLLFLNNLNDLELIFLYICPPLWKKMSQKHVKKITKNKIYIGGGFEQLWISGCGDSHAKSQY